MIRALLLLALVAIAAAAWYLYSEYGAQDEVSPVPLPPPMEPEPERPGPRYPVPEPPPESAALPESEPGTPAERRPPLPPLQDSDEPLREMLATLFEGQEIDAWLLPTRIIERSVTTIDSLDGAPIPLRFRPLRHVPGLPETYTRDRQIFLSPNNAARYRPLLALLEAADPEALVELYFDYYPLFQEAFEAQGERDGHFNDRVVEVIDHLLATPERPLPVELVRPEVFYEYADPDLESMSFGRKVLVRMGPDNAAAVKSWLRQVRDQIADG